MGLSIQSRRDEIRGSLQPKRTGDGAGRSAPKSSAADAALMVQEDIDGCLVGCASVNVEEFVALARFCEMPVI